jgi:outer membrane protein TolC
MKELELRRVDESVKAEVVKIMEVRLALGETFRLDLDTAKAKYAAAQLEIHASEGKVAESRVILAGALGIPVQALEGVAFVWLDLDKLPAEGDLSLDRVQVAGLLNRLDVLRALAEYASAEAALELEVAKRYPDITLGPGFLYDQGDKKFTLGLSVSLPVFNQNQGPIAEADARRKEVAARFLSLQAQAIQEMDGGLARYRSAVSEYGAAQRMMLALEATEKAVRRQMELGESDRVALTGVRLESVLGSLSRLGALRKSQSALGSLEDAVQRPLGSAALLPEAPLTNPRERR